MISGIDSPDSGQVSKHARSPSLVAHIKLCSHLQRKPVETLRCGTDAAHQHAANEDGLDVEKEQGDGCSQGRKVDSELVKFRLDIDWENDYNCPSALPCPHVASDAAIHGLRRSFTYLSASHRRHPIST